MIAKEKATQEINEKYAKAKELEKLTDTQLEALKSTLQAEKWWSGLSETEKKEANVTAKTEAD